MKPLAGVGLSKCAHAQSRICLVAIELIGILPNGTSLLDHQQRLQVQRLIRRRDWSQAFEPRWSGSSIRTECCSGTSSAELSAPAGPCGPMTAPASMGFAIGQADNQVAAFVDRCLSDRDCLLRLWHLFRPSRPFPLSHLVDPQCYPH